MTTVVCTKLASLGAYQLAAKLLEFAHSHQDVAKWVCEVATTPSAGDSDDEIPEPKRTERQGSFIMVMGDKPWCVNTQLYLVASGRIATASELTIERHREVVVDQRGISRGDGVYERRMLVLAAAFADSSYPLAATIVYRAIVSHILSRAKQEDYSKASDCLITMKILALAIQDWQGIGKHRGFLAALRNRHPSKTSFWKAYGQKIGIRLEEGGVGA